MLKNLKLLHPQIARIFADWMVKSVTYVLPKTAPRLNLTNFPPPRSPRVDAFAPAHLALSGSLRESPERLPKPPGSREVSLLSPIKADDAALKCDGGCLGPILHAEFGEDVLQMELHCGRR